MSGTTIDSGLSADSGLLARLSRPAEVNLLGAYQGAAETARGIWANRLSQANQASGEAYQGAINQQTGEFDPNKYRQNLAAAGPTAALAAQSGLTTNQQLSDQQLEQAFKKLGFVQHQAGALLDGGDLSDAAIMGTFQKGIAAGVMTMPEVMRQLQTLPPDAAGRKAWAQQHLDSAQSSEQQLKEQYGTRQELDTGGEKQFPVVPPARRGGTPTITKTTDPNTGANLEEVTLEITDPTTGAKTYQKTKIPRDYMPGANAPPGRGGQPAQSSFPNGGRNTVPPALLDPNKPPPAPGATGAPSPPAASAAPPAATPAPAQPILAAPPQGQPQTLETDIGLRTKAATDMGGMQKRLIAGQSALDALDMARTGPGTANETHMLAFLQAHNYAPPPKGQMSDTEYRQILVKNLLRFAQDSSRTAGTDLGLETQIHSNANADEMLKGANRHVLLQDLGILKRDIAQTEEMPAPSGEGAIREHIAKFPANTDPRAFMIDHLPPDEQKALLDEAKKQGPNGKIYRSLEIAHRRGYITPPSQSEPAAAPPPPPASAPPKSTAGRPLAMAPTNYLAMA